MPMFLTLYVIACGSWEGLVDELHLVDAEIGAAARGHLHPVGDVGREVAGDRPRAAARLVRGDDEADPADDVVEGVRARPLEDAVDREQNLLPEHGVKRGPELRVVEVRGGRR